jgi:hypothetical protein
MTLRRYLNSIHILYTVFITKYLVKINTFGLK